MDSDKLVESIHGDCKHGSMSCGVMIILVFARAQRSYLRKFMPRHLESRRSLQRLHDLRMAGTHAGSSQGFPVCVPVEIARDVLVVEVVHQNVEIRLDGAQDIMLQSTPLVVITFPDDVFPCAASHLLVYLIVDCSYDRFGSKFYAQGAGT